AVRRDGLAGVVAAEEQVAEALRPVGARAAARDQRVAGYLEACGSVRLLPDLERRAREKCDARPLARAGRRGAALVLTRLRDRDRAGHSVVRVDTRDHAAPDEPDVDLPGIVDIGRCGRTVRRGALNVLEREAARISARLLDEVVAGLHVQAVLGVGR